MVTAAKQATQTIYDRYLEGLLDPSSEGELACIQLVQVTEMRRRNINPHEDRSFLKAVQENFARLKACEPGTLRRRQAEAEAAVKVAEDEAIRAKAAVDAARQHLEGVRKEEHTILHSLRNIEAARSRFPNVAAVTAAQAKEMGFDA